MAQRQEGWKTGKAFFIVKRQDKEAKRRTYMNAPHQFSYLFSAKQKCHPFFLNNNAAKQQCHPFF
jgi:hypothetical protein